MPFDRWLVRRVRRARGMTQKDLATHVGVGSDHISRLERGVQSPSRDVMERIAAVLELDVYALDRPPSITHLAPKIDTIPATVPANHGREEQPMGPVLTPREIEAIKRRIFEAVHLHQTDEQKIAALQLAEEYLSELEESLGSHEAPEQHRGHVPSSQS